MTTPTLSPSVLVHEIVSNLVVREFPTESKKRLGINNDGGYVMADLGSSYDAYISAGVSNEESFTRDVLASVSIPKEHAYAFDGTIKDYPWSYTKEIQYIRKNIGDTESDTVTSLKVLIQPYQNILLKMDIEGGEYPWINCLETADLLRFRQVVIEFHGIMSVKSWGAEYHDKLKALRAFSKTHYIVHAHGNNFGPYAMGIPDVLELTYVRKDLFPQEPPLNQTVFPIEGLDFPNKVNRPDYPLGFYPFIGAKTT